jgi:hypothetical protein
MGMCVAAGWIFVCVAGSTLPQFRNQHVAAALLVAVLLGHVVLTNDYFEALDQQKSPLPEAVDSVLGYVADNGGQITAGSFDTGFAPLWKWTLIEQLRLEKFDDLQQHVDFSRFTGAEIVFVDPSSWRRASGEEFTVTREEADKARTVYENRFTNPPFWKIEVKDLRYTDDGETTATAL